MRRLPKSHTFPGGFKVEILSAPYGELLDEGSFAEYSTVTRSAGRIVLWDQLTPKQAWRILMHEMIHAIVDAQHWVEREVRK